MIHIVKGFGIVNKAEIDVFLDSCFFHGPADIGNLISGFSAFSKTSLIPHVQGNRNPSKTVGAERGPQRADRLKPQSQKTNQSNHMDHILSNSMKLSHAV